MITKRASHNYAEALPRFLAAEGHAYNTSLSAQKVHRLELQPPSRLSRFRCF
jgi:hypothetical protein